MNESSFLPLKTVANVRDLGGIPTADGLVVRGGVLLRGASLSGLSAKEAKALAETWCVRTVVDLRTPQEQAEKPDRDVPGADRFALPVFDEQTSGISYEKSQKLQDKVKAIPNMPELYRGMVTRPDYVANLAVILQTITERLIADPDAAVYFHCTAGKDRTGIVSYLLLSLLGVPYETVLEDYLKTNEVRDPKDTLRVAAVSVLLRDPEVTEGLKKVFRAEPEYLNAAAAAIEATYGSVDNFLRNAIGISPETRDAFRAVVLIK